MSSALILSVTIVSDAPSKRTTPVRTESQMYIRMQWVNMGAVYRQFNKTLKKVYEGWGNTMSVYNAFVQANINGNTGMGSCFIND